VEVMIFLAVSGFMFIVAAAFVSGKQSNAEFRQGMNDIASQIQQVINDVSDGHYPSGSFTCTPGGSSGPTFSSGSTGQGANQGCMFLGQVMQFDIQDSLGTNHPDEYNVYTVAGNQYANGTTTGPDLSTGLSGASGAHPAAVFSNSGGPDLTSRKTLEWGLQVTGVYGSVTASPQTCSITLTFNGHTSTPFTENCTSFQSIWTNAGGTWANGATISLGSFVITLSITGGGSSGTTIEALGFFGSFGSYSGGALESGSQTTTVATVSGSALGQTEGTVAGASGNEISKITDANIVTQPDIIICFQNGSHKGSVTIGGSIGQRLTVSEQFGANGVCP